MNHLLSLSASLALATSSLAPATLSATANTPPPLVLSEVLPNALNESTGELIEIINTGSTSLDLSGWSFVDGSGTPQGLSAYGRTLSFGIAGVVLQPGQVGLLLDKDYAAEYDGELLALDSSDEVLLLTTSSGNLNLANAADSVTLLAADGSIVDTFAWSSDPGSEVTFARRSTSSGVTALAVSDTRSLGYVAAEPAPASKPLVVLSELLPNPSTGEEFIELYSQDDGPVDLATLQLRDASGKTVVLEGTLGSAGFVVVYKSDTGLSLNNNGDTLELLWIGGASPEVLDTTTYTSAAPQLSWSRIDGAFSWSTSATPGDANTLTAPLSPDPDPDEPTAAEPLDETDDDLDDTPTSVAALSDLHDLEEGDLVTAVGTVIATTGTFYKHTLHIADGGAAVLVKDSDTQLALGTVVQITGTLKRYAGQLRIEAESVTKQGEGALDPIVVEPGQIAEKHVGQLVHLEGVVARRSGKSFRVAARDDDKDTLISIRKSTGIAAKAPAKGTTVGVTGIVMHSGEQLVVAPRQASDITTGSTTGVALPRSGANPITLVLSALGAALVGTALPRVARRVVRRAGS